VVLRQDGVADLLSVCQQISGTLRHAYKFIF